MNTVCIKTENDALKLSGESRKVLLLEEMRLKKSFKSSQRKNVWCSEEVSSMYKGLEKRRIFVHSV